MILAALVMYQRARKLGILASDPSNFIPMAELQIEAYLAAVNALSLVDQKVAWIAIPLAAESDYVVGHILWFRVLLDDIVTPASETKEAVKAYPGGTVCPRKKGCGGSGRQRHPL